MINDPGTDWGAIGVPEFLVILLILALAYFLIWLLWNSSRNTTKAPQVIRPGDRVRALQILRIPLPQEAHAVDFAVEGIVKSIGKGEVSVQVGTEVTRCYLHGAVLLERRAS